MKGKEDKKIQFNVQLNWMANKKGLLSAYDADGTLLIATPPAFGGEGKPWSPEHLFLGAISSCFMTTFLVFAEKSKLNISRYNCSIIGQISFSEGRYRFILIDLYPKIFIADEASREKAETVLKKTHQYCIITNSVSAPIFYHSEIITEKLWINKSLVTK